MQTILYSILATAMLAAGVLSQLVPPTFNNTPPVDGDKDGALRLHNYYRGRVGVPALTWCDNLTEIAQVAADWEAGADIPESPINFTRRFPRSVNFTRRFSQNESYSLQVVYISPGIPRVFGAFYHATLAFWADHIHYHGEVIPNGDFFHYAPYTQMVWNGTTRLGMAGATNRENGTFVVAAYSPPGNIHGQKPFNNNTACNNTSGVI